MCVDYCAGLRWRERKAGAAQVAAALNQEFVPVPARRPTLDEVAELLATG